MISNNDQLAETLSSRGWHLNPHGRLMQKRYGDRLARAGIDGDMVIFGCVEDRADDSHVLISSFTCLLPLPMERAESLAALFEGFL